METEKTEKSTVLLVTLRVQPWEKQKEKKKEEEQPLVLIRWCQLQRMFLRELKGKNDKCAWITSGNPEK